MNDPPTSRWAPERPEGPRRPRRQDALDVDVHLAREGLRLLVILVYLGICLWLTVAYTAPYGFAPLLWWAMRPRKAISEP